MLAFVTLALFLSATPSLALWPQPRQITTGEAALRLAEDFAINLDGFDAPQDLSDAVERTAGFLKNDKLQVLVPDRGASVADKAKGAVALKSLKVSLATDAAVTSIAEESIKPVGTRSEGYTLVVPEDGSEAVLTANTTLGLFRGLTTFSQIWYEIEGTAYTVKAPFNIEDSPAYPYRGLMLDTARNYYPVADIKRTLDGMSWVKINTLHWHVVDSQSFPLVIPGHENLSQTGAYTPTSIYTPEDVKDLVDYAAARGIDIVAEIDTPGHTAIIHKAHPEHIACNDASPWQKFAYQPPAGQLRLASPETTNFTASVLTSAASLFKSAYFGTGGDEINTNCYTEDPETQEDLASQNLTLNTALDRFTKVTHDALREVGKKTVVWEEMLLSHPVNLANDTLIMVWISAENAAKVAEKGFKIIHASNEYFYLDCGGGGWVGQNPLGNSWCDPFKTWQKAYSFDPLKGLKPEQYPLVQGGQHLLWAEQSGPQNLDNVVWPRAASSAEVFWSGAGGDIGKALPRLHDVSFRFRQRGIRSISLQPEWCALRDGACDLNA